MGSNGPEPLWIRHWSLKVAFILANSGDTMGLHRLSSEERAAC